MTHEKVEAQMDLKGWHTSEARGFEGAESEYASVRAHFAEYAAFHRSAAEYVAELEALVRELADDMEAEIHANYGAVRDEDYQMDASLVHPAMKPRFRRDMEIVERARRALSAPSPEPENT